MDARCTTCYYFQIIIPERYCGHPEHHIQLDEVHKHCTNYINLTSKEYPDRPIKKTYDETYAKIGAT
jgi:hypothetical protein